MKSAAAIVIAVLALQRVLHAEPLPPGGPTLATPTGAGGAADLDWMCKQNAAANRAAQKRFARKLKVNPDNLLHLYASPQEGPTDRGVGLSKDPLGEEMSRCHKASGGFVSLSLRSVTGCLGEECEGGTSMTIQTSVIFVKGTQRIQAKMPPMDIDDFVQKLYSLGGAFDYDGDGIPEVLLVYDDYEQGEDYERTFQLRSFKNGKLISYGASPPLNDDSRMEDVDGDGRPDFYSPGPYARITRSTPGPASDPKAVRSQFVYHSLPSGRFSASDAVAQAALAKVCPAQENRAVADFRAQATATKQDLGDMLLHFVICERARGKSAAEVLKALDSECHRWVQRGEWDGNNNFFIYGESTKPPRRTCPVWLKQVVAVVPPLVLASEAK